MPAPRCRELTDLVGNTPILWIDEPFATGGRGFWAKLEAATPVA
jgi:cysteine synthase A